MDGLAEAPNRITIILDARQRQELDAIAAEEQVSVAAVARKAVREFLARRISPTADECEAVAI